MVKRKIPQSPLTLVPEIYMLSSSTKGMMATHYPKCEAENPDDSKFCKECASPLKPPGDVSITKTIKTSPKRIARGTTIAGKYQILQKLGEGGMGYRPHSSLGYRPPAPEAVIAQKLSLQEIH
jgi:hypothetical protein